MIRHGIIELARLGALPNAQDADEERLSMQERLILSITTPVSDEEAKILVRLFGLDDCYGLAWTLLHLVESAPGWPIAECLETPTNQWIVRLRESATRAGLLE